MQPNHRGAELSPGSGMMPVATAALDSREFLRLIRSKGGEWRNKK
jgi:hypothetical protein